MLLAAGILSIYIPDTKAGCRIWTALDLGADLENFEMHENRTAYPAI